MLFSTGEAPRTMLLGTTLIVEGIEGPALAAWSGVDATFESTIGLVRRVCGWIVELKLGPTAPGWDPSWIYVRSAEGVDRTLAEIQRAMRDHGVVYTEVQHAPLMSTVRAAPCADLTLTAVDRGPLAVIARALGAAAAEAAYAMYVAVQALCPRRAVIIADAILGSARTEYWPRDLLGAPRAPRLGLGRG